MKETPTIKWWNYPIIRKKDRRQKRVRPLYSADRRKDNRRKE